MKKKKISILFFADKDITLNYTLFPFFTTKYHSNFDYYTKIEDVYTIDKNDILIIVGKMFTNLSPFEKYDLLQKTSVKYKHLIFLDDLDGAEIHFFEYFHFFDLYFKKQVYSDHSTYLKNFDGNKLFTDFYSKNMGEKVKTISNYNGQFFGDPNDLEKIKVAWNIGIGSIPPKNSKILQFILKNFGAKYVGLFQNKFPKNRGFSKKTMNKCQARFNFNPKRNHIDFQRKLFLELIAENHLFLSGKINFKEYLNEVQNVVAVLSPFGFGEVCFRDFEAIINGAVLVKPNMDHLKTWPNIYIPNQTYLPIDWNGSDLVEKVENLLSKPIFIKELSQNAFQVLGEAHENLDDKISEFIDLILSLK